MSNFTFIQWVQLADALAWLAVLCALFPSLIAVWRGRETITDFMTLPIILIAINRMWACSAWLIFPHEMPITNEFLLRTAVHIFSILCAVIVVATYRRAVMREVS